MSLRLIIVVAVLVVSSTALAQDLGPAERQAAAEAAYDRGTRTYRGGNYAQAARWYETANELAPAAAAIIQAIRAHDRAGNTLRAGTLAAHLAAEYGEERLGRYAPLLPRATEQGFRVVITCEDCTVEIDGEREIFRTLFLSPDVAHSVVGIFSDGRAEEEVRGGAGEQAEVTLAPPVEEPEVAVEGSEGTVDGTGTGDTGRPLGAPRDRREEGGGGGISPAFFITGLVLTAAVGGVAVWSWLDTLDAANVYEDMPTRAGLDAGRALELRTTLLDIGAGVLGVASLVFLIFTDWGGAPDDEARPTRRADTPAITSIGAAPTRSGGLTMGVGGTF